MATDNEKLQALMQEITETNRKFDDALEAVSSILALLEEDHKAGYPPNMELHRKLTEVIKAQEEAKIFSDAANLAYQEMARELYGVSS